MANNQNLTTSAHRALAHEYKSLQEEPVEGFRVKLIEDNLREWEVAIFGPPETLYQGGYFKVRVGYLCIYSQSTLSTTNNCQLIRFSFETSLYILCRSPLMYPLFSLNFFDTKICKWCL